MNLNPEQIAELLEQLHSFADYHESLWPEQGMGIAQVAMRDAITAINQLTKQVAEERKTRKKMWSKMDELEEDICNMQAKIDELEDFAIWMTGCGYDFCQHDYFNKQRDKLLKGDIAAITGEDDEQQ